MQKKNAYELKLKKINIYILHYIILTFLLFTINYISETLQWLTTLINILEFNLFVIFNRGIWKNKKTINIVTIRTLNIILFIGTDYKG